MWRSCGVQPSHKERAIGVVRCKKEGMLLQPLRWCCVDCVIHHEREVREEQHHTYMWRKQAIIEWSWHVNSIVACCHSAKLFAHASRDFRSQHGICYIPTNQKCFVNILFFYYWQIVFAARWNGFAGRSLETSVVTERRYFGHNDMNRQVFSIVMDTIML